MIDAGLQGRYPDAILLAERVGSGAIQVMATKLEAGAFQTMLDDYGIEAGDKDLLRLCRQFSSYGFVAVDDRLLYIAKLQDLHQQYQAGDLTLRGMARQLGLDYRELHDLMLSKGLTV